MKKGFLRKLAACALCAAMAVVMPTHTEATADTQGMQSIAPIGAMSDDVYITSEIYPTAGARIEMVTQILDEEENVFLEKGELAPLPAGNYTLRVTVYASQGVGDLRAWMVLDERDNMRCSVGPSRGFGVAPELAVRTLLPMSNLSLQVSDLAHFSLPQYADAGAVAIGGESLASEEGFLIPEASIYDDNLYQIDVHIWVGEVPDADLTI